VPDQQAKQSSTPNVRPSPEFFLSLRDNKRLRNR
jgi:hypothetical protein